MNQMLEIQKSKLIMKWSLQQSFKIQFINQRNQKINFLHFNIMEKSSLSQITKNDIKQLFKNQAVQNLVFTQIQQIFQECLSVIVIYQKLYIKIKHKLKKSNFHSDENDFSLFMIKINKSFPLDNSVRLYLLDGIYQPKIFDTRDLIYQALGQEWNYRKRLKEIVQKLQNLEQKLVKRNENYLALQKTGNFLLGDVFVYNQLEQHTSLSIFVDKSKQNNSTLNAVSQTHFFTFKKVMKKVFKSKQQEQYQTKSKTLYGKKFILSKCCQLQCIDSLQVNMPAKQVSMNILKYKMIKSFNQYESLSKKMIFNDQENLKQFIRIVLKNLPKYQATKMQFLPSYQKASQYKQQSVFQKVIQLNELQSRLQGSNSNSSPKQIDKSKRQQLINRLNKSYQKLIEFYSARANPYYLIYVNKLNWLYSKYFTQKGNDEKEEREKSKLAKSKSAQY